jgi:rod shape determining protein RodA
MKEYLLKNWKLFISLLILSTLSLLMLSSLSMNKTDNLSSFYRQLVFLIISCGFLWLFSKIDYNFLKNHTSFSLLFYLIWLIALVLLLVMGQTTRGITGWFKLGFFSVQPVEFMKIALIILLSKLLYEKKPEIWNFLNILKSGIIVGIPAVLALLQPDLGSVVIMFLIWIVLLVVCGMRKIHLVLIIFLVCLSGFIGFKYVMKDYQKDRLISFRNPNLDPTGLNYNQRQSIIAVGSGRLWGKGLGWGTQTQLQFLPESKTDFIFASISEELGFIGVSILLLAFLMMFSYFWDVISFSKNNFSKFIIVGFWVKIFVEMVINIGMNVGLLPVIGIALPFVSAGGSHLMVDFIMLGMILNINNR